MKKYLCIVLALCMLLAMAACGAKPNQAPADNSDPVKNDPAPAEKTVIKLSMTDSVDSITYKLAQEFAEKVNADCGDAFDFQIYPSDQLGSYDVASQECIRGSVEMLISGIDAGLDERVTIAYSPYLTSSYQDAKEVFAKDSFLYNFTDEICSSLNLKFLGFCVSDLSGMCLTNKCPEDPYLPGSGMQLQLRCPPSNQNRALIELLGYIPTSVDWGEVYSSAQTGVIDGFLGAGSYVALTQFADVINYYVPINNSCNSNNIVVSGKFWDTLTAEQQESFATHAAEIFEQSCDKAEEIDAEYLEKLEEAGITVIMPKEGELEALADAARAVAWPTMKDFLGEEVYNQMVEYYNVQVG